MIKRNHIRHFLSIADAGSFAQAAARLHITQPTLSAGIADLERLTGARLFVRDRRHVRLTAALSDGQRLYAVRYATDDAAPTLSHRWSESRGGMAVVSEPLETGEGGWVPVPAGSFCVFEDDGARVATFRPGRIAAAA